MSKGVSFVMKTNRISLTERILGVSCGVYHTLAVDSKGGDMRIHHLAGGTLHSLWANPNLWRK
jgi:hypothetical protein